MDKHFYNLGRMAVIKAKIDDLNKKYDHNIYELSNENDNVYIFSVDVGGALECALLLEFDGFLFPVSNDAYELVSCVLDQVPN